MKTWDWKFTADNSESTILQVQKQLSTDMRGWKWKHRYKRKEIMSF